MSSHSRSSLPPVVSPQSVPVETVQLFTFDTEELEVCRVNTFLKITKKVYHNGHTEPNLEIRYLDLEKDGAFLMYTVADNTDVARLWNIRVVYGATSPLPDKVEYALRSEEDAFTFQRLVTGYSPCQRFKNVPASTLEQHLMKRATKTESVGEVQLLWPQPPEPLDEPLSPPNSTPSGLSTRTQSISRPGSILSAPSAPSIRSAYVQQGPKGRDLLVSRAELPPLLVLFGRGAASDGSNKPYHMWRVNIIDLQCRLWPGNPNELDLISSSSAESKSGRTKPFDVHILVVQNVEPWNLCRIRPGQYTRYFERHSCEALSLRFQRPEDAYMFKECFLELQAKALGILPSSPPSSSSSVARSRQPLDSASASYSRRPSDAGSAPDPRSVPVLVIPPDVSGFHPPWVDPRSRPEGYAPSFLDAPTVSEDPYTTYPNRAPTLGRQLSGWPENSPAPTTVTVEEEPQDDRTGHRDNGRWTSLRTWDSRQGQPASGFLHDSREEAPSSRRGRHTATAARTGSQGGLFSSIFRSLN